MGRVGRNNSKMLLSILIRSSSHEFEWKREECHLIRKPDPPVLVAITKEPAGKIKTQSVQFMDYNLHR